MENNKLIQVLLTLLSSCMVSSHSHVYKCVCQQHSELLYNDLVWKISSHLDQVSAQLLVSTLTINQIKSM